MTTREKFDALLDIVCEHFNVDKEMVIGGSRTVIYVTCRSHIRAIAMKTFMKNEKTEIVAHWLGKDRSTMFHLKKKHEDAMDVDQHYRADHVLLLEKTRHLL